MPRQTISQYERNGLWNQRPFQPKPPSFHATMVGATWSPDVSLLKYAKQRRLTSPRRWTGQVRRGVADQQAQRQPVALRGAQRLQLGLEDGERSGPAAGGDVPRHRGHHVLD